MSAAVQRTPASSPPPSPPVKHRCRERKVARAWHWLPAVVVVCLLLSGCRRPAPATGLYRFADHLATDAVVEAPAIATSGEEAPPLEWDFSNQEVTWVPLRGMVGFKSDGELAVKGENGESPEIVSPAEPAIDWTRYQSVLIRMVAGGGKRIRLRFQQQFYTQKLAPPLRYRVYRFQLRLNSPAFKGRLIIEPTDSPNQMVLIDYIRLVPRRTSFPKAAGLTFVGKRSAWRRAIYTHTPATITYKIAIPNRAKLRFGIGVFRSNRPVTFRVSAGGEVLFSERLGDANRWRDAEIDLSRWAGETRKLVFETRGATDTVGFWATPVVSSAPPKRKPNVIVYLVDTLRADHTSLYGYRRDTTPTLKRLGAEGVVFEDCYAQSSWTKPSVASLLTSLHTFAHGLRQFIDTIPPGAVTLAQLLRRNGYITASFLGNPFSGRNSGLERGVDYLFEYPALEPYRRREEEATDSAALNRLAFPWLERHADEPFFLYLHSTDPHYPYFPPAAEEARFADPARTPAFKRDYAKLCGAIGHYGGGPVFNRTRARAKGIDPDAWIREAKNRYDAEIAFNDQSIGRLAAKLKELGILDNTLLIVVSDHGEEFLEHGWTTHGHSLYEELIHVVFLMWNPKLLPTPRRISEPVQLIDVMPTVLDLLGLKTDGVLEGQSLVPLLRGEPFQRVGAVMSSRYAKPGPPPPGGDIPENRISTVARLDTHWKLIYRRDGRRVGLKKVELFDRLRDPGDNHDVASRHPDVVKRMMKETIRWIGEQKKLHQLLGESQKSKLDARTLERLRTLGYIGRETPSAAAGKSKE